MLQSTITQLRASRVSWLAAALLPLPALLTTNSADNAEISCLYLGLACAWLATEILRTGGMPASHVEWKAKMSAIVCTIATNVTLFLALGLAVGVKSKFPFPLMATFSAIPAIGLIPWLTMRLRHPIAAIILAAVILLAAKLAGCVAARVVYGPRFDADGHIAADWNSARLMISTFWTLTGALSFGLLLASLKRFKARPGVCD